MSLIRATTRPYGPATVDVQIEQGADFVMKFTLTKNAAPWDLTNATFRAHFQLSVPTAQCIDLDVAPVDLANGEVQVEFSAASSLGPPFDALPPLAEARPIRPDQYPLGGWLFEITDAGTTTRIAEGAFFLDRDPCLM